MSPKQRKHYCVFTPGCMTREETSSERRGEKVGVERIEAATDKKKKKSIVKEDEKTKAGGRQGEV